MKPLQKWLASAVFIGSALSQSAIAQTHYEAFLERAETQNFTQNIFNVTAADGASVQTYLNKPATSINIDSQALLSADDFMLELPGLSDLFAVKEKTIINQLGGHNWVGDVVFLDPFGFETGIQGRAYFVEINSEVTGVIYTADEVIHIYPDGAGGQLVVRSDPSEFNNENDVVDGDSHSHTEEPQAAPPIGGIRDGVSPATLASPYTIDIMFVVTDRVAQISDELANIEAMLTISNDVLANSLVPTRLRAVETYYTDYVEDGNLTTDLGRLRNPSDGYMDEIHTIREDVGADLVMIISDSNNYCGVAYLDATIDWAFSATFTGCMNTYTPIHELGHNFGAQHDVENGTNYFYSFGYGIYNNTRDPYWRTIMSYQCPGGGCGRVPYFTSPLLSHNDIPLGDPQTADNARVLKIRSAEIAGYFPSTTPYCNQYTATNDAHVTAGRAFIETETICTLEFFGNCYQSTTNTNYIAVGSNESLGTNNGGDTNTLYEDPANYYSLTDSCDSSAGELSFAPEIQNIRSISLAASLDISGEVYDANADQVISVEAKSTSSSEWTNATLSEGSFSVEVPNTNYGEAIIDFRTTDNTGESFTFSVTLDHEIGEVPTIEINEPAQVFDSLVQISGESIDPDSDVIEIRYQIDGDGNPNNGEWLSIPIQNRFWSIEIPNVPLGFRTIYLYGVDESNQISEVVNTNVEIIPGVAPQCTFANVIPATNAVAGNIELTGLVSDENGSDVTVEYRLDGGTWETLEFYSRLTYRPIITRRIEGLTLQNNSSVTIDMRAVDSTNLVTDCGTRTYTATYPLGDEAPSCEFIEIEKYEGNLRYYFSTSDPNGNQSQMFAKEASQAEWLQTWPNTIAGGLIPIPGIGEFTIQGRVVDSTSLEGICETQFTVIDEEYTPEISSSYGYFESSLESVVVTAQAVDYDGDIVVVETREVGTTDWYPMEQLDAYGNYRLELGLIANGVYSYEIRAVDSGGRISNIAITDFEVDIEVAPTLSNITYSLDLRRLTISGEANDQNGDLDRIYLQLDDRPTISVNGISNWDTAFLNIENGSHTITIYAEDLRGNRSDETTIDFDLNPGSTPTIDSIEITTLENGASIFVSASDIDGDLLSAYISIDGGSFTRYDNPTSGSWSVNIPGLEGGNHTIDVYVTDLYGNNSNIETRSFTIELAQACYESENNEHVNQGRASTTTVCQFEFLGNCYNPTTTYNANGSNNNLGSSGNSVTALLEVNPGYYELISACPTVDSIAPVITVLGDNPLEISQGETFIDPGATATDNVDNNVEVSASGIENVDTSIIGTYEITYTAADTTGNQATPQTRIINVVADTVPPVITLLGENPMNILLGSEYIEPNASAFDNVDGDISANIEISGDVDTSIEGQYFVTYSVSDVAGNPTSVTREVNVVGDAVAPTITLLGSVNITIDINTVFTDPGATALDDVDGDITERIIVSGDVDTSIAGTYYLRYNVSDDAGNPADEVVRTIEVVDGPACSTSTLSEHVVAGRVYEQYFSYYSTGTNTYLGSTFNDANTVMALEESSPGSWSQVNNCN